ncbi:MAG TPA: CotH kinase family protein [Bacteroidales bacterium]|jgi:hypothetical protein|nr:CotH kinase family protein [Bacteroidales bacterium]
MFYKKIIKIAIFLTILAGTTSCYREEIVLIPETDDNLQLESLLYFNSKPCFFDEATNTLTYSIVETELQNFNPKLSFSPLVKVYYKGKLLKNSEYLQSDSENFEYKKAYSFYFVTKNDSVEIQLRFTPLPIVRLSKTLTIFDEPKIPAYFQIVYPESFKSDYSCYIGVEIRGATSQIYPKKSLGFNTLANQDIKSYQMTTLVGNRENWKWILDAAYMDNLRVRNSVSFYVWAKISNSPNHFSINTTPVELFINNEHQGLYFLGENFSNEILNLKANSEVLYKAYDWSEGATRFEFANDNISKNEFWDGWEQKHPDPKFYLNWNPLKDLRNFIVNSSDENFRDSISYYIDIDNFIDYYLFMNLLFALDNAGKNTFLIKSAQTGKFVIIPWDLDATWGLFWDGTYNEPTFITTNYLYDRLFELNPNDFKTKLKNRWFALRQNVFSQEEILLEFEKPLSLILKSGIIEKENLIWKLNINTEAEYNYIKTWISARLNYLDNYFSNLS